MIMNAHPVMGAQIIAPVTKLAPELPIIRHHHEWYNGSGYPDRLIGDEIPKLARILHVADAFEAMTAARPYRMTPLTAEQALAELRKFAGIQFDPVVVDAFVEDALGGRRRRPGSRPEPRPGAAPRPGRRPDDLGDRDAGRGRRARPAGCRRRRRHAAAHGPTARRPTPILDAPVRRDVRRAAPAPLSAPDTIAGCCSAASSSG